MNPYLIIAVLLGWGASLGGTFWWAYDAGQTAEIAKHAQLEEVARTVQEAAQQGAADEIAKIKIRNTTVQQRFATETITHLVYRDCRHSPDGLRLVNEALAGPDHAAKGGVRADQPVDGRHVRGDQPKADRGGPSASRVFARAGDPR